MNKYAEEIQQFTLMDDTFMGAVFDDKECAEILLSVILGKQLTVNYIKTQYNIQNLQGRSARLDIKARDTDGNVYNCEVENANNRTIPERARYNGSLMDASELYTRAVRFVKVRLFVYLKTNNPIGKAANVDAHEYNKG